MWVWLDRPTPARLADLGRSHVWPMICWDPSGRAALLAGARPRSRRSRLRRRSAQRATGPGHRRGQRRPWKGCARDLLALASKNALAAASVPPTRRSDGWSRRPAGSWPAPPADLDAALAVLRDRSNPEDRVRGPPQERTISPRRRRICPLRGYSSDRTSLRSWRHCILALVCTTRGQPVSSGRGSAPMRTVWTIWTGCAGLMGSCVRAAATPAAGRSPTADTDARRVVAGPRSRSGRCSTAAGRR